MQPVEIRPNIFWIGVNDPITEYFEGLWPIKKEGVSYNSYLIRDDRNVIIDLTKEIMTDEYLAQIRSLLNLNRIDYIVMNHVEPDHASAVVQIHALAPQATILCTERASKMLNTFYGLNEGIRTVEDGETLNLGTHTLQFVHTPNVHWPETMMTYEQSEQVLFSCDGFGGYKALQNSIFDEDQPNLDDYIRESLRYYANILPMYSQAVRRAIEKAGKLPIGVVAPSHGLIWRKNPQQIIQLYQTWAGYVETGGENRITVLLGSMYGNTTRMLSQVIEGIEQTGTPVEVLDVVKTHVSYILPEVWRSRGVLVAAPTYEGALFPPMTSVLDLLAQKKLFNKKSARIGSRGWSGGAQRTFDRLMGELRWEMIDSLEFVGVPKADELEQGKALGIRFGRAITPALN